MANHFEIPPWLQYVVAVSSVVSSFGVIIALTQISITRKQFNTQLATTTDQFTLLNQGYLNLDVQPTLFSPKSAPGTPMLPGCVYQLINLNAVLENVGNMPVIYSIQSCKIFFNNVAVFDFPADSVGSAVLYPKQKSTFGLGQAFLDPQHKLFSISQIQALGITFKFKFNYHDFNNDHIKTVERTFAVSLEDYRIGGTYKDILDSL